MSNLILLKVESLLLRVEDGEGAGHVHNAAREPQCCCHARTARCLAGASSESHRFSTFLSANVQFLPGWFSSTARLGVRQLSHIARSVQADRCSP